MLVNAQSHLYEDTRQNMHVTKHNNANQTFWIFYFLCVFGFLMQKKVKIDKKENIQSFKKKKKNCQKHARMITKKIAKQGPNM